MKNSQEDDKRIDKLLENFHYELNDLGIDGDEARLAYLMLLGVEDSDDERVLQVFDKMKELENNGVPIDSFTEIIGMRGFEEWFEKYMEENPEFAKEVINSVVVDEFERMLNEIDEEIGD